MCVYKAQVNLWCDGFPSIVVGVWSIPGPVHTISTVPYVLYNVCLKQAATLLLQQNCSLLKY